MKTIGLLGGMSWESTAIYYRVLNEEMKKAAGGRHSAKIILNSVDFEPIEQMMKVSDFDNIVGILIEKAQSVERAGADFLLICTNTMHKLAPQIQENIAIPILHIADATADVLISKNIKTVGLMGTIPTMEQDFYKGQLKEKYGLKVIIPNEADQTITHSVIEELCMGEILEASKAEYLRIFDDLAGQGAEAVILGCTEIGMLDKDGEAKIPLLDTTLIHAKAAVKQALK